MGKAWRRFRSLHRGWQGAIVAVAVAVIAAGALISSGSRGAATESGASATNLDQRATTNTPPLTTPPSSTTISTTTAPPTTTTTAVPTTTAPPRLTLTGHVEVLDSVWFEGDPGYAPPAPGSPCSGRDGFADIAPGGTVIISGANGSALATTTLAAGQIVHKVAGTEIERWQREDLIDAIYELRVAQAGRDPLAVAQLNVQRADLRVADLEAGGLPPFEGRAFQAAWCQVTFNPPDLPIEDAYGFTVTHRGTTVIARSEIESAGGTAALAIGQ